MGALIAILVIVGGWEALKDGYRHMRDSSRKPKPGTGGRRYSGNHSRGGGGSRGGSSARHDSTGYWASEVGHGFPHFRHGFAKGWSRHQQIRDDLYRDRQKARAEHLENRTGVVADVQEYRKRQRAAQDKIAETSAPAETEDSQEQDTPLPSEQGRRGRSQRLPWPESGMAAVTPITGNNSETSRPPADSSGEPSDTPPGGSPEDTPGGNGSGPGNTPDGPSGSSDGTGSSPSQEGSSQVPADTSYDEVLQQFRQFAEQAEQQAAQLGQIRGQAEQLTDAAQAAEVDPQSLGEMADIVDACKKAEEEAKTLQEQASAFPDSFAKRHGMLADAHQSAPVRAAEQDFYTGG